MIGDDQLRKLANDLAPWPGREIADELIALRAMVARFESLASHLEHVGPCRVCGDLAIEIRERLERK